MEKTGKVTEPIDSAAPGPGMHLVPAPAGLARSGEWTPEELRAKVGREAELRAIAVEYYKSQMEERKHYYWLSKKDKDGGRKPSLSKEGALNLCGLFMVVPEYDQPAETFQEGHYTVRARCHLRSLRTGDIVASGDGLCTTREDKYAYRWMWPSEAKAQGIDTAGLPTRKVSGRQGGTFTQYRVSNQNLANEYNTVLKMADKRATVAAALKLPLVSELFTQDLEEIAQDREATEEGATAEAEDPEVRAAVLAKVNVLAQEAQVGEAKLHALIRGTTKRGDQAKDDLASMTVEELEKLAGQLEKMSQKPVQP